MTPKIVIDGYNLIHRVAELRAFLEEDLEAARERLLAYLMAYQATRKIEIVVVFDGENVGLPHTRSQGGVQVVFSKPPQKADALLKQLILNERNRRRLTVVSSDKEIFGYARTLGAQCLRSEQFFEKFFRRADGDPVSAYYRNKYEEGLSPEEFDHWLRIFQKENPSRNDEDPISENS